MRKLLFFLAAVSLVLFAEKAPCHELAPSIGVPSLNSLRYEEIRVLGPVERSIGTGRFLSVDPVLNIEKAVKSPQSWNRYAYVGNSPVNAIDPDGRETFLVNRKLGGGPPRATWNVLSHTFIATTKGGLHTYSWGNTPDGKTKGKWFVDRPEDVAAAKQALAAGEVRKEGDDKLDPFVQQAFNEVHNKPNDRSNHPNCGVAGNCKTEANILLDRANELQDAAQPPPPQAKTGISGALTRLLKWLF